MAKGKPLVEPEDEEVGQSDSGEESGNASGSDGSEENVESDSISDKEEKKEGKKGKPSQRKPIAKDGDIDEGGRSVYVAGLPFDFKKKDVQDLFEKQGAMITYIHMPVFPDSKRSRGFATVTFTKREYVAIALEMDGSKLKGGRWLQVAELDKSKLKKASKKKKQTPAPSSEPNAPAPAEAAADAKHKAKETRKRRYTERPEGCNKVFVGNIPLDAKEGELRDLFQRCGTVKNIAMAKDKKTNKFKYGCKGIAFVEFEPNTEDEPTEKAFSLSGIVRIHANKLLIDYAPDSVVCYKCGAKNHYRGDCPKFPSSKKDTSESKKSDNKRTSAGSKGSKKIKLSEDD